MRRSLKEILDGLMDARPESREMVAAALRDGQIHLRRLRESATEQLPLAAVAMWEQEQIYKLLIELLRSE